MTEVCVIGTAVNPVPTETAWSGIELLVSCQVKGLVELGADVTLVSVKGSLWKDWDKINLLEVPVEGPDLEKCFYEGYKNQIKGYPCVIDNSNGKQARLANKRTINVSHWLQAPWSMGFRNVVCISKAHAKWTRAQYPFKDRGPMVVMNGIDPSTFPYTADKGDELLFFSVLGPYKGADTVLRLAQEHPEYRFGFGGRNTEYTQVIQEAAKKHENVTCYGEVSHDEKKRIMGRARALLQLPKPYNPHEMYPFMDILPMTIIEANLCGTPVIGLAEGGVPEMVEDEVNGYLCHSLDEVVEAMGKIHQVDTLGCRRFAEERFSYLRMSREYLALVDRVKSGDWW